MNSANQNLQNTFAIDTEYEILQIDSSTPSIKLNNIGQNTVLDPNLSSLNLGAYTDENGVAIYNIGGIIKYTDIAGRIKLSIVSKVFKQIQNDTNTEVINIQNISNIRVNINVTSEDKNIKNTYIYNIQI